jgi:DNA ligase-1
MSILSLIDKLAATPSRNEKVAILKANEGNRLLVAVLHAALNPYIRYFIKKIEQPTSYSGKLSLDDAISYLSKLSNRDVTGNAASEFLTNLLSQLTKDDAVVLSRIILHDLRCGVQDSTVNTVWPGLIPTFDVCLANKDLAGITYPAFAQMKMDAARCHLSMNNVGQTIALSRGGNEFVLNGHFDSYARLLMKPGEVWDGELVFYKDGQPLPRKISNGLANRALKGTLPADQMKDAVFVTWDIVDFTSTIPYIQRFDELCSRFENLPRNANGLIKKDCIRIIPWDVVHSEHDARYYAEELMSEGYEGAVIKNFDFVWEPKRVKGMGKIKAENEADLIVVGWEEGDGKYAGMLGALVCETSDGKVRVNVGGGYSDEERATINRGNSQGKIVAVVYNEVIREDGSPTYSLFLPRFIEFRTDKKVANTFGELK